PVVVHQQQRDLIHGISRCFEGGAAALLRALKQWSMVKTRRHRPQSRHNRRRRAPAGDTIAGGNVCSGRSVVNFLRQKMPLVNTPAAHTTLPPRRDLTERPGRGAWGPIRPRSAVARLRAKKLNLRKFLREKTAFSGRWPHARSAVAYRTLGGTFLHPRS